MPLLHHRAPQGSGNAGRRGGNSYEYFLNEGPFVIRVPYYIIGDRRRDPKLETYP